MTSRYPLITLFLGLRSDSSAAFKHHRHELWSKFHGEAGGKPSYAGVSLLHRLSGSPKNLELITAALTSVAAIQHPIKLDFGRNFVYPNPAADKVCAAHWCRSVKYELVSPEVMVLYKTLVKELGSVTVHRNSPTALRRDNSPSLPQHHKIRENPNGYRRLHVTASVISGVDKDTALGIYREHNSVDTTKKFGTLVGDSFKLLIREDYKTFKTIMRIPFLRAE